MTRHLSLALATSLLVAGSAAAQQPDRPRTIIGPRGNAGPGWTFGYSNEDGSRLVLGLSTSSGGMRDTLGLLVTSIAAGGPAEKAGLEEGNRLVSINGVALKLNASDASDPEMAGVLGRRLQRELEKVGAGEAVTLGVYANGQTKQVRITPIRADELPSHGGMLRARADTRSTIGASIGGFASPRDTLGVFVVAVAEDGPLAKAGIFEGSRIASINGVDLRVPAADLGDEFMTSARVRRLTREVEKIEAGGNATLRVYSNGQYRDVTVKVVRRSELKQDGGVSIFQSGWPGAVFTGPPGALQLDNGNRVRIEMEHLLDGALRERIEEALRDANIHFRGKIDAWRQDTTERQRETRPLLRERSGDDATMPVEEVLKQLEQRLRESQERVGIPFRSAAAGAGDVFTMAPVAESFSGTVMFTPPAGQAPGGFEYTYVSPELQRLQSTPPQSGAQSGTQGRSRRSSIYRSSKAAAQQGGFTVDGIRMSPINANLASYLGRGSERGVLILEVASGWTGITEGDVILSIDGKAVSDGDEITVEIQQDREQCVELLRAGVAVKSVIRRR